MEYCPARSPLSFSNRFSGGTRRSFMFVERLSIRNFLRAILCKSLDNFCDSSLLKTFSASLSLNDLIILKTYKPFNIKRQTGIPRASNSHYEKIPPWVQLSSCENRGASKNEFPGKAWERGELGETTEIRIGRGQAAPVFNCK
jgi:hypothetical protein